MWPAHYKEDTFPSPKGGLINRTPLYGKNQSHVTLLPDTRLITVVNGLKFNSKQRMFAKIPVQICHWQLIWPQGAVLSRLTNISYFQK